MLRHHADLQQGQSLISVSASSGPIAAEKYEGDKQPTSSHKVTNESTAGSLKWGSGTAIVSENRAARCSALDRHRYKGRGKRLRLACAAAADAAGTARPIFLLRRSCFKAFTHEHAWGPRQLKQRKLWR